MYIVEQKNIELKPGQFWSIDRDIYSGRFRLGSAKPY